MKWISLYLIFILLLGCKKESHINLNDLNLPMVSTLSITNIGRLYKCTGSLIPDTTFPILEKGICYDTMDNPSIKNNRNFIDIDYSNISRFYPNNYTMKIGNLKESKTYFVRAYATNINGTSYGKVLSFTTDAKSKPVIGDDYGGGQIAYFYQKGDSGYIEGELHGIIVADKDQKDTVIWGGYTKQGIGDGKENTLYSVNEFGLKETSARICYDLVFNGFDDWYSPSFSEFYKITQIRDVIRNFVDNGWYWTSSEIYAPFDETGPYYFNLIKEKVENFVGPSSVKTFSKMRVRAIRYF